MPSTRPKPAAEPEACSSPDMRRLTVRLYFAREGIISRFRPTFSRHGVTEPQWRVLRLLAMVDGLESGETSRQAQVRPASLSRMVKDLAAHGLLTRTISERDARRSILALTPAGRKKAADLEQDIEPIRAAIEAHHGSDRIRTLSAVLDEFIQAVSMLPGAKTEAVDDE